VSAEMFLRLLRERRSVRKFRPMTLERELLARLVEHATWAPSAGNRQDWYFTVVTSPRVRLRMAQAVRDRWTSIAAAHQDLGMIHELAAYAAHFGDFEEAPALVIVSARAVDSLHEHLLGKDASATAGSFASAAMAAQNLMLAAHALGLGTCCMTGALAARNELGKIAGLGNKQEIVCLIAVGWPDEAPPAPERKPPTETVRFLE